MLVRGSCFSLLLPASLTLGGIQPAAAEQFTRWREHVLGTSMQWTVETQEQALADATEAWAVAEIERLESIFSRYSPDSELNRLAGLQGQSTRISVDLARVLKWSEELRQLTHGAFDIRVRALLSSSLESNVASARLQQTPFVIQHGDSARPQLTVMDWPEPGWTLDAVAKGYILDQVAVMALDKFPGLKGVCVNIGGDVRIAGELTTLINVENPFHAAEGSEPIVSWEQSKASGIATSGGYRRFEDTSSGCRSHLIDARSGQSVEQVASVTVVARTAMEADGLATAVSVLGVEQGLDLIASRPQWACLIVDAKGIIHTSSRWGEVTGVQPGGSALLQAGDESQAAASPVDIKTMASMVDKPAGLHVHFELTRPSGAAYRRPYLALWLEDADGFPVKTALLWLQTDQPGPRWHRDLTRWHRNDRVRKAAEQRELIGVISGATRGPGQYHAHFDGTDSEGNKLSPGKYTLFLEVTREHGTHQLMRQSVEWSGYPIPVTELEGNVEISAFSFEYLPAASVAPETASTSADRPSSGTTAYSAEKR